MLKNSLQKCFKKLKNCWDFKELISLHINQSVYFRKLSSVILIIIVILFIYFVNALINKTTLFIIHIVFSKTQMKLKPFRGFKGRWNITTLILQPWLAIWWFIFFVVWQMKNTLLETGANPGSGAAKFF